jgi:hypothetical protein
VLATACAAAAAAILISASEIFQHMANYTRPALQKQIVRVLLMVPVYALCSFFSLAFPVAGPYLDVARELYEALTIYAFTWFVLAYLELDANLSFASFGELLASKPPLPHMWPLTRLLPPWPMGTPFIRSVQTGVLNYVVVRPLTAIFSLSLTPFGYYKAGVIDGRNAYIYLASINSVSQGWAIYCLIMLYRATAADLAGIKVLAKFLCVKGVVFFTFWQARPRARRRRVRLVLPVAADGVCASGWQGVLVALGMELGAVQRVIKPHGHDSSADLAVRLQNFVIWCAARRPRCPACDCAQALTLSAPPRARSIEMLFFAVAHSYAFSAREFWQEAGPSGAPPPRSVWANVSTVFDWSDVGQNMVGQGARCVSLCIVCLHLQSRSRAACHSALWRHGAGGRHAQRGQCGAGRRGVAVSAAAQAACQARQRQQQRRRRRARPAARGAAARDARGVRGAAAART